MAVLENGAGFDLHYVPRSPDRWCWERTEGRAQEEADPQADDSGAEEGGRRTDAEVLGSEAEGDEMSDAATFRSKAAGVRARLAGAGFSTVDTERTYNDIVSSLLKEAESSASRGGNVAAHVVDSQCCLPDCQPAVLAVKLRGHFEHLGFKVSAELSTARILAVRIEW